jgi:hypothetical protein
VRRQNLTRFVVKDRDYGRSDQRDGCRPTIC